MIIRPTTQKNFDLNLVVKAFDPGGTTGFCMLTIKDYEVSSILLDEFKTSVKVEEYLDYPIPENYKQIIIYESFLLYTLDAKLPSVEVIGVLKHEARKRKLVLHPKTPQSRILAKKKFPLQVAKVPSHSGDALSHVMTYLLTTYHMTDIPDFYESYKLCRKNFARNNLVPIELLK